MSQIKQKQRHLLSVLQQYSEPVGLVTLLEALGEGFAERSVRRWLGDFVKQGIVEKTGQRRGTKYLLVSNLREKKKERESFIPPEGPSDELISTVFSEKNRAAIAYVQQPLFKRDPAGYQHAWFDQYVPNETFYLPREKRSEMLARGVRAEAGELAGTYARKIYEKLLIDLSYNSSRLEGNTYSLLDTKKLLIEGKGNDTKLYEEKLMILNHKEAIRYLVDNVHRISVDYNEVCTLHYLLADSLLEARYAGKVRDHSVRIGLSAYMSLDSPSQLENQLRMVCEKAAKINNPHEQSFFLLVHISYLQAFADVNKRTARLSANIPLLTQNLVPLSFGEVDKDDYLKATLAIYELNNTAPLMELYCFSYFRTCIQYDKSVESELWDTIRARYRTQRRTMLGYIIKKQIVGRVLQEYIQGQAEKLIPEHDREAFIEDVFEDIKYIDEPRLVGLGVTPEELEAWLILRARNG